MSWGQPFCDYVRAHIVGPLGMRETAWLQPDARLPRFAAMNVKQGGQLVQQPAAEARALNFKDHALTPGGFGLASTLGDYSRFARLLLNGGSFEDRRSGV